jgi:hypothetical protein
VVPVKIRLAVVPLHTVVVDAAKLAVGNGFMVTVVCCAVMLAVQGFVPVLVIVVRAYTFVMGVGVVLVMLPVGMLPLPEASRFMVCVALLTPFIL